MEVTLSGRCLGAGERTEVPKRAELTLTILRMGQLSEG